MYCRIFIYVVANFEFQLIPNRLTNLEYTLFQWVSSFLNSFFKEPCVPITPSKVVTTNSMVLFSPCTRHCGNSSINWKILTNQSTRICYNRWMGRSRTLPNTGNRLKHRKRPWCEVSLMSTELNTLERSQIDSHNNLLIWLF